MLRRLYDWTIHWADTPYGLWALLVLAFCESSFFPIPPDVLLIALAISVPAKSFKFALYCSIGSVFGGMFGYFLGWQFMDVVGMKIIDLYGLTARYEAVADLYHKYDAWAVGIAGFTPIPYKLFTITAGACRIDFPVFVLTSLLSRSARFFIVAGLIFRFGPGIKPFIEKYFNWLAILFVILLIGGFIVVKYVL